MRAHKQDLLRALKAEADALQGVHSDLRINLQKLQVETRELVSSLNIPMASIK